MMGKSINDISTAAIMRRKTLHLLLFILLLPFILVGFGAEVESGNNLQTEGENAIYPIAILLENDSAVSLLGKSFIEINSVLGNPDEEGNSGWSGPHQYILYTPEEGFIRFASPESVENEIAVSIILGPGQEILGAVVGMSFQDIVEILGTPNFGPEIGIDDLYYLDYYFGETNDQVPEIFVSFVAISMYSSTEYAFVKFESYMLDEALSQSASTDW